MAATKKEPKDEDFQREIIDFDTEAPEGAAFMAFSKATGLSRFVDIPWPQGLGPVTDKSVRKGTAGRLSKSDYLVVTWTVDEGHALSRVLTPEFSLQRHRVLGVDGLAVASRGCLRSDEELFSAHRKSSRRPDRWAWHEERR